MFLDFGRQPAWNCPIPEQDSTAAMTGTEDEEISVRGTADNYSARTVRDD